MKRVIFTFLIIAITTAAQAKYSGGSGDANDPYQLASKADLLIMAADANDYNKCFILTADINMTSQVFTSAIIDKASFIGAFDGSGHKIILFTINASSVERVGLFKSVDSNGSIKNLGLENFSVKGLNYVGGLLGVNYAGTISNCYSTGTVNGSDSVGGLVGANGGIINNCYSTGDANGSHTYLGGLVGYNYEGTIDNCYSTAAVKGHDSIGGLVGWNEYGTISNCHSAGDVNGTFDVGGLAGDNPYGTISNCYSTGDVNASFASVGGLVGWNFGNITNCYATGDVNGYSFALGGLVGANGDTITNCFATGHVSGPSNSKEIGGLVGSTSGYIENCYSTGKASGGIRVGGFVGKNNDGMITRCYSTGTVTGDTNVGGFVGYTNLPSYVTFDYFLETAGPNNGYGTSLTDTQMKQQASFVSWGFLNIWRICEGFDYPRLKAFKYSAGTGEANNPFQIATPCDLMALANDANDYNKCFIMTADIDLDPNLPGNRIYTTAVISYASSTAGLNYDGNAFTGIFDGAGHSIFNLTIDTNGSANDYLGLFGEINQGEIKNLGLENIYIRSTDDSNSPYLNNFNYIGALAGKKQNGNINNCFSTGSISSGNGTFAIGGLIGQGGNIRNCFSTCSVICGNSSSGIGGLAGSGTDINGCFATGNVTSGNNSGALGGLTGTGVDINNCFATGSIAGGNSIGVGGLAGTNHGNINNCYSRGYVTGGAANVGGLVGSNRPFCNITNSYFLDTAGPDNNLGEPLTDTQMKQQASFTGWDFDVNWAICESTNYPRLRWQIPAADFLCPDGVNFIDYSFFASRWLNTNCAAYNDCDKTDFDLSGTVDIDDLEMFCYDWLQGL